jgi:hypothetical protein
MQESFSHAHLSGTTNTRSWMYATSLNELSKKMVWHDLGQLNGIAKISFSVRTTATKSLCLRSPR